MSNINDFRILKRLHTKDGFKAWYTYIPQYYKKNWWNVYKWEYFYWHGYHNEFYSLKEAKDFINEEIEKRNRLNPEFISDKIIHIK